MAKEAFYFTHDYGSRNDPKLQKVLMKLGHEGKSVYWDLVEMLYEEGGFLLLAECENYAFALRTNCDCITKLVNDFDLFKKDALSFWSESILRRLDKRDEKSKKASESAKTRWDKANALKKDANASNTDAIKEIKGKDIKENKESITPVAQGHQEVLPVNPSNASMAKKEKDFIDLFNKITSRSFKVLDVKSKGQFKARLTDGNTSKEFRIAITTAFKEMTKRGTVNYLTPEFITRPVEFNKYVNMPMEEEKPRTLKLQL